MTFLAKIVAWITAGYPEGVPGPDRVPLFALLKRGLSDDEVKAVAKDLKDLGEFDSADIGVLITQITDELPIGTTAMIVLFEHLWLRDLRAAIEASGGQVMFTEHIPGAVVDQVEEAAQA